MKKYSTFPKTSEFHNQIFCVIDNRWESLYTPPAEMKSVYSAVPADWTPGKSYPCAEIKSVYSAALADLARYSQRLQYQMQQSSLTTLLFLPYI